jgi:sugar transferase (PEP-CTERM/EpsH1 system associated)
MEDLLFLAQRIPYPPDKGDKIRSWQVLRHLAKRYRIHLGCLYDEPDDSRHIPRLAQMCASVCCRPVRPARAKLHMLGSLARGQALTLGHFHDPGLAQWVNNTVARHQPSRSYVFSSAMARYVINYRHGIRVLDMVDVDSEKWRAYATRRATPLRQIYAREGRRLFDFERHAAGEFDATLFATSAEADLFTSLAPEAEARVVMMKNGVDLDCFDPAASYANPYPRGTPVVVFTGSMDYRPNIDAVTWFTKSVLPLVHERRPDLQFWIVGRNPAPIVRRLGALPQVRVTGEVADVRPYLAHADVAVAPMTIARGIQNKIIEAMAMATPVVVTPEAAASLDAVSGEEILIAAAPWDFAAAIDAVMAGSHPALGAHARARIERDYRWRFDVLDALLAPADRHLALTDG